MKTLKLFIVMLSFATFGVAQNTVDVPFQGSCIDVEDGDISSSLIWTSDVDGQVLVGSSGNVPLSEGQHVITASCTDSGGKSASKSVTIMVDFNDPPAVTITLPADGSNHSE